jgi:hypothetical protein
MTERKACGALLPDGRECSAIVLLSDGRCYQHSKKTRARAKATSAEGGSGSRIRATIGEVPEGANLSTSEGRLGYLSYALKIALAKKASLAQAETMTRIVREARAEHLEGQLAQAFEELELKARTILATRGNHLRRIG